MDAVLSFAAVFNATCQIQKEIRIDGVVVVPFQRFAMIIRNALRVFIFSG